MNVKTVKVVRVVGGKREVIELPEGEARELGIAAAPPHPLSIPYLMDGLFVAVEDNGEEATCPNCGTTIRDVILRQRVGCPHCFDRFADTIDRLLRLRRRRETHTDRIPLRLQRYRKLFVEREALLSQLSLAVEEEDFETAAGLRDQLTQLDTDDNARES